MNRLDARLCWTALACLACVLVAGCGDDSSSGGGSGAAADKPVKVAAIMAALDNDFYVAQKDGIESAAKEMDGVDVNVSAGSKREASTEVVSLIEDAIAKSPDVIMVNGSENDPLLPVLKRVIAADIPLVLFDAPAPQLKGQYATYIGTDNAAGGKADGEWLRDHLPDGGKIGAILCVAGHPVTVARFTGFKQGLGDPQKYKIVATGDATCDTTKARNIMEDMITAHPDLDAVFSTSDGQSIAAVPALEAAKKDPLFVSFDAQPDAVKLISQGKVLDASAAWSAKQLGGDALRAAVAVARGEKVPAEKTIPTTVVDKSNAASWNG
jgi:ribose transport system substrate-binding protein